jgi:uncharacterized DUF497 family protein
VAEDVAALAGATGLAERERNTMPNPRFVDVEWAENKNLINQKKHRISFVEAATVFSDPFELTIADPEHSIVEYRFVSIGQSFSQKLLVVSYTEREGRIRIISARKPTRRERRAYQER